MTSVFSENLRIQNAENFKSLIDSSDKTRLYFTFGKTLPWNDEALPDIPNTSTRSLYDVWDNMIGAKLIAGNEAKNIIPRHNWTANTVYAMYDDKVSSDYLFDSEFYVVTPDWNVYKCLSNNNGAASTVMPTQIFVDKAIEELDGYIWKYMYTVSTSDQLRFTTENYVPVKTLTTSDGSLQWDVQNGATAGTIEAIKILTPGSGYSNANTISVTITGDGQDATAIARVNTASNIISSIVMTNVGRGYSYADVSIADSQSGLGATARAIISPPEGHGSDPLKELGGHYIILNPRIRGTESNKFPASNDLRQFAIIANPKERGTDKIAANSLYAQFTSAILDTADANYVLDEVVYQGGSLLSATFTGRVEAWDPGNNTISLVNTRGNLQSDVLIGTTTGTARYVLSITQKELEPYTGSVLYINNIQTITRSPDQTEDVKIIIGF